MKVLMLGLDGVSHSLIRRFAESGLMENTQELLRLGTLVAVDSTVPDLSAVAWTSMVTGQNPGKHGVYGFTDLEAKSYSVYYTNSSHNRGRPLWDIFADLGRSSVVINLPGTYPVLPIQGMMISGFVAVDLNKSVWPMDWLDWLVRVGYRLDVEVEKYAEYPDYLLEDIEKTLKKRMETILHLWEKVEWDLFFGVITETDRLHHFFWDAIENENHRYHSDMLGFYRWIDAFIGNLFDRCSANSRRKSAFLMSSDHGFTQAQCEVNVNEWLREAGFLAYTRETPESLEDLAPSTRAFALDPARIYINTVPKFPQGRSMDSRQFNKLIRELEEKLSQATVSVPANGSTDPLPLCRQVFRGEELYHGPNSESAPDLVLLPTPGVDLKSKTNGGPTVREPHLPGMHLREEAFFYAEGQAVEKDGRPTILDLAPSIMNLAKIPKALWMEMDGKNILR